MNDRTTKKDPNNRGQEEQLKHLRSIWQEWRDSNPRPSVLETDALTS